VADLASASDGVDDEGDAQAQAVGTRH